METDNAAALKEMLTGIEDLDPELERHLGTSDGGIPVIRHPLVVSVFHTTLQNKWVNAQLKAKKEKLEECKINGDYFTYVFLHEKPYRVNALLQIADSVEDQQWWGLVGTVWSNVEFNSQSMELWEHIFATDRPGREFMMDDEDRLDLASMPDELTVYRGVAAKGCTGMSWTLRRETAEWFANRFDHRRAKKGVWTGTVSKSDIIAYITDRGESEVVVRPKDVRGKKFIELPADHKYPGKREALVAEKVRTLDPDLIALVE